MENNSGEPWEAESNPEKEWKTNLSLSCVPTAGQNLGREKIEQTYALSFGHMAGSRSAN